MSVVCVCGRAVMWVRLRICRYDDDDETQITQNSSVEIEEENAPQQPHSRTTPIRDREGTPNIYNAAANVASAIDKLLNTLNSNRTTSIRNEPKALVDTEMIVDR